MTTWPLDPRQAAPPSAGVDRRRRLGALNLVGALAQVPRLAALFPAAVALGYSSRSGRSSPRARSSAAVRLGARARHDAARSASGVREGFLVVSLTWLLAAGFGALPYLLSGEEPARRSPSTRTSRRCPGSRRRARASSRTSEGCRARCCMWRQFTQWLGGMGIIVLALAVLPRLRVGGRQLLESELPGPELEPLATSIRDTARRLWLLYVALTGVDRRFLAIFGWTRRRRRDERLRRGRARVHDACPPAASRPRRDSIEAFGAASQWVIASSWSLAGVNFALLYRALRPAAAARRRPRRGVPALPRLLLASASACPR